MTIFSCSENPSKGSRGPQRKRLERAVENLPALSVVPRDIAICNAVYEYRAMIASQIQQLLFPARNGNMRSMLVQTQDRLKRLFHHGYLARDEQPVKLSEGRLPLVYFLEKKGASLLADQLGVEVGALDWTPRHNAGGASHLFINHLLRTNDVRVALTAALQQANYLLVRWLDDRTLKRQHWKDYVSIAEPDGRLVQRAIVPDGYVQFSDGQYQYHQFLEVDLATVVGRSSVVGRRDWAQKVQTYLAYYETGGYQARYESTSLRVLTVTTSQERLAHLKSVTEEAGGRSRFWFTTFAELTSEWALHEPIWQMAGKTDRYVLVR